jgi:hypothetical protein
MIGVAHPTPYPEVAEWNFKWIKAHRYWIGLLAGARISDHHERRL